MAASSSLPREGDEDDEEQAEAMQQTAANADEQ